MPEPKVPAQILWPQDISGSNDVRSAPAVALSIATKFAAVILKSAQTDSRAHMATHCARIGRFGAG
jgi:hypothetical protein